MIIAPIISVWYNGYVLGQGLHVYMLFSCPALHPSFLGQDYICPCMKCLFRSNRRCQYLSNLTYINYSGALLGIPNTVVFWIILDLSVSCLSLESFKDRLMLAFQGAASNLQGGSGFPELWRKEGASQRF